MHMCAARESFRDVSFRDVSCVSFNIRVCLWEVRVVTAMNEAEGTLCRNTLIILYWRLRVI